MESFVCLHGYFISEIGNKQRLDFLKLFYPLVVPEHFEDSQLCFIKCNIKTQQYIILSTVISWLPHSLYL